MFNGFPQKRKYPFHLNSIRKLLLRIKILFLFFKTLKITLSLKTRKERASWVEIWEN